MQKSICEANVGWIFVHYWNGVNSNRVIGSNNQMAGNA